MQYNSVSKPQRPVYQLNTLNFIIHKLYISLSFLKGKNKLNLNIVNRGEWF